jgi:hypothetical protein
MPQILILCAALWSLNTAFAANPFSDPDVYWDHESGERVFFPPTGKGAPYLKLGGTVVSDRKLTLNGTEVSVAGGHFSIELALPDDSNPFELRIQAPNDEQEKTYQLKYVWKKPRTPSKKGKERGADEWLSLEPILVESPSRFTWAIVEGYGLMAFDSIGGAIVSGGGGWAPEFHWTPNWTVTGGIGASLLKSNTQQFVCALEYKFAIRRGIDKTIDLEVSGGGQTWMGSIGFVPVVGTSLRLSRSYIFPASTFLSWTKAFFVSYTYAFAPIPLHQFRIGLSIPLN